MAQASDNNVPNRFPLIVQPENRALSTRKDAKLVNGYAERYNQEEYWILSRPGLLTDDDIGAAIGRGIFNWQGDIYSVWDTTLYKNGVSLGTVNGAGGTYRFDSTRGSAPKLVLGNGVKAYTYNVADGLDEITDGDFPTSFVKGWAFLDGTLYVMESNCKIHGSDINAPNNWDPLNQITAQISPDAGVYLAKHMFYVLALKQWTTEVFYDAQNSSGSPLGSVPGAKLNFGCASAETVQEIDDILLWVATNKGADPQIVRVEGMKATIVSTDAIDRLLAGWDFDLVNSWQHKENGHRFYIVSSLSDNLTLVYDLDQGLWYQWTDAETGGPMEMVSSTVNADGQFLWQHGDNGKTYLVNKDFNDDDGELITVDIVTPNFDGNTSNEKTMAAMRFIGDRTPGSVIEMRYSDDDYQTWSTYQRVDMSLENPELTDLGSFRRRALNLRHRRPVAMRLKALDLRLLLGSN